MSDTRRLKAMIVSTAVGFFFGVFWYIVIICAASSLGPELEYPTFIAGPFVLPVLMLFVRRKVRIGCTVAGFAVVYATLIPCYLELPIRSRAAEAQSAMRSLATGLETYCLEHKNYPPACDEAGNPVSYGEKGVSLGYIRRALQIQESDSDVMDPFCKKNKGVFPGSCYYRYATNGSSCWILASLGPNGKADIKIEDFCDPKKANCDVRKFRMEYAVLYDTSNGTTSDGDIIKTGP